MDSRPPAPTTSASRFVAVPTRRVNHTSSLCHAPPPPPPQRQGDTVASSYTITPVSSNYYNDEYPSQLHNPRSPPRRGHSSLNQQIPVQVQCVNKIDDEPLMGMGKRMITVEVKGMQSSSLRSGKVIVTKPHDLEAEGKAILETYAACQSDDSLLRTTVRGRLVDTATGASVLEVFPFLVRTSLTSTQADMSDWVGAIRDELAAGVHPAPCALYARRVSKGIDAAVPISGADVFSAAKALLGVPSSISPSVPIVLQWCLHIEATVCEAVKIKKEIPVPVAPTPVLGDEESSSLVDRVYRAALLEQEYRGVMVDRSSTGTILTRTEEKALMRALRRAQRVPLPDDDSDL